MVSKRNRNRKTAEKVVQPAEKPAEINVEQILTAVTQKVVEVLKPDLEQKVTAVQTSLSNQINHQSSSPPPPLPSRLIGGATFLKSVAINHVAINDVAINDVAAMLAINECNQCN